MWRAEDETALGRTVDLRRMVEGAYVGEGQYGGRPFFRKVQDARWRSPAMQRPVFMYYVTGGGYWCLASSSEDAPGQDPEDCESHAFSTATDDSPMPTNPFRTRGFGTVSSPHRFNYLDVRMFSGDAARDRIGSDVNYGRDNPSCLHEAGPWRRNGCFIPRVPEDRGSDTDTTSGWETYRSHEGRRHDWYHYNGLAGEFFIIPENGSWELRSYPP